MVDEDILVDDPDVLLGYMRQTKRPVFHNSNLFFRDIQYAIKDYFEDRLGVTIKPEEAQRIAKDVTKSFERQGVLKQVNSNGYLLIYPDLVTPKQGGTIGVLNGTAALPPMAGNASTALQMAEKELATQAPAAKPVAAKATAPAAPKPATAAAAPSGAAPAGAVPAGAKAPPPWLKK
jgi:hypothetical protein